MAPCTFLCRFYQERSNVVAWVELGGGRWLALSHVGGAVVFEHPNMWERIA